MFKLNISIVRVDNVEIDLFSVQTVNLSIELISVFSKSKV